MKLFATLYLMLLISSCSKNPGNTEVTPTEKGTLTGSIKVYDKYGNENLNYNNVSIKLIDKQNLSSSASVSTEGKFQFNNVLFGSVIVTVNKPGYGFTDTLKFDHVKKNDTLSDIYLIEELPFSLKLYRAGYANGAFSYSTSCNYLTTTDSYMLTDFICFSKDADVSVNHSSLFWSPSSFTNVQFISGTFGGSSSLAYKTLTDAGFKKGDQIYITVFPSIGKFWPLYYNQNINYSIISYKVTNASNVCSFTLNE